jgi:vanillate O-demethylase ferredoxin subunit
VIRTTIVRLKLEAEGVLGIELKAESGASLPSFEPGAHVDVYLDNGLVRQYSLCGDSSDTDVYRLGVGLPANSRGGSSYLHEYLQVGDSLVISEPRTLFGLSREGKSHRFIAGGIGITPILSMIHWCIRHAVPWKLDYCVRSRTRAAYLDELQPFAPNVHVHADEDLAGKLPDIDALLCDVDVDEHIYCCGPSGLMDSVSRIAQRRGIPRENLHFERFNAPLPITAGAGDQVFTVVLAKQGLRCVVGPDESILESLERQGVCLPFSCRAGLCRSCEVSVLSGEVDHRDYILSEEEQRSGKSLMICVSRAKSDELVIDV